MIALLLAATLALPHGAEAVRIADDTWPEKVVEAKIGDRVWWWSNDCAPQLLTGHASSIECTAPALRSVHVVDRQSGKKLPGVRVVWGVDAMRAELPDAMLPFAITDADGNAFLPLPPSGTVRMRVDGPRAASWWQKVAPGHAAVRLAAVAATPAPLRLTIAGSGPATRAVVQIELSDARSWAVARDGKMLLPAVPPVPVLIAAWSEFAAPLVLELDAAAMPRTIDLPRGSSVNGRVVDARGRPIEGAAVEGVVAIGTLPRGLRRRARSTRAGTFVLRGIPAGTMQLKLAKADRATVMRSIEATGDVDAGDITLPPSRQIALRVIDSDGRPVGGATARVSDGPSGTAGRDGIVKIDSVAAEDVTVHVIARGFRATEIEVDRAAKFPLDVQLSRGVRVIGRIVSAKSGAVAGPGDVLVNNNGAQRVVAFDESGVIDIGGLQAGKLALEIRAPALTPLAIDARTLTADEVWDLGTLRLDDGAVLTGRVLDGQAPLPGARIRALRRRDAAAALAVVMNDWIATDSMEDGSFTLSGLTPGRHLLLFDAPGFAPRVLDVEADAEPMTVSMERARGVIVDCAPVRRCGSEVRLLYAGAAYPWASTSAIVRDGRARIASASPGTAIVRLLRDGHVVHEREVQIGATAETELQIRLAAATLRGTVASAGRPRRDGGLVELRTALRPSLGLPIFLEHRTSDGQVAGGGWQTELPSAETAFVDDAGNFVFAELEPGEYEATYRRDGKTARPVTIDVRTGSAHVVLEVAPGELRGRVLHEDGRPARFATVQVTDAAGAQSLVVSDQFGNFETIGIAAGRATLRAEDGQSVASAAVDIDASRPALVEMVMRPRPVS